MIVIIFTATLGLFILSLRSFSSEGFFDGFGLENTFVGIIMSYFTVKVFVKFQSMKKLNYKVYTTEAKKIVISIINLLIPFLIVMIPVAIIQQVLEASKMATLIDAIGAPFVYLFEHTNIELLNGVIYSFMCSVGSFLGAGLDTVFSEASMGNIVNPTFIRVFVLIPFIFSFVLAVLIFGRRSNRIYGTVGLVPGSFGYTNVVHYSYPLLLNPMSFIPIIITPIITTVVSYYLCLGFNIDVLGSTNNASLIFFNAYDATNNGLGILVQGISVAISFAIFIPAIMLNTYAKKKAFKDNVKHLYKKYLIAKDRNKDVTIFDFDFELGETAKVLCTQLIKDMELMKEVREKVIEFNSKRDSYKAKEFETKRREYLDKLKKQLKIKSYFQPIVGNHVDFDESGKPTYFEIKGMECLMRWWYEENYVIPPLAIELARSAGLEYEINSYLWENMLLNVDRKKCKSFITFNISMTCLEKESFIDDLMEMFNRYDIDPSGFVIEITEEDEFTNEDLALNKICELKEKGFDFAIDDYGAGQTSMKYFQTNAFELVKIDGDLVKKAKENEQVYDIIGNIRELGKRGQKYANIQFKVLCEFIEDQDSFERLKELKVDYYQGFLFGKAQEFDEIVTSPMMVKGSQKHV